MHHLDGRHRLSYIYPFLLFYDNDNNNDDLAAISAETMKIHHTKHHNTYITNLNASLEKLDAAVSSGDVSGIIALQGALKFNGGGHLNHTLFWENLSPEKSAPSGALEAAIKESFGGFDKFKTELSTKSVAVQGSGWGWLGYNTSTGTHRASRILHFLFPYHLKAT